MDKKKKWKMPHTYAIIVVLIIICTILTYIVPAGTYDRVVNDEGRTVVVPGSFHYVDKTPVGPFQMVQAIPTGMGEVAWIVFLVFIIGGAFGIINATGAVEAGLGAAIKKVNGKDTILIVFLMTIFSIGGATFGMAESTLVFVPILVVMARKMGYDAITGMAIVNLGACCGFAGGWMNMFTVGVAQGICELEIFSGMGFRLIVHAMVLVIAIFFVLRYAKKVKANPENSIIYDIEAAGGNNVEETEVLEFTGKRKAVLICIVIGFAVLIYGILNGWGTSSHLSSIFLIMGIVCGFVGGLSVDEVCNSFIEGAKGLTFGALVVGLARAMVVVLTQGQIIDTIVYGLSSALDGMPAAIAAGLMVVVQTIINLPINSGSGQAAATMPIMAVLADALDVSRQTAVLAYQYGDGLSNSLWPSSGVLMASLSIAGIPYEKWLKFVLKIILVMYVVVIAMTMVSVVIGYQ